MEGILAENESMRETYVQNMQGNCGPRNEQFGPMGTLNLELLNELNERVDILMAENALLVEQKAVISGELDGCIYELEKRTMELTSLTEEKTVLLQDIKHLQQRVQQAETDREDSANQAIHSNNLSSKLQNDCDVLRGTVEEWKQQCLLAEKDLDITRIELKDLLAKYEEDGQGSFNRIKACEDRVKELHLQLLQKTQDLDSALETNRKLKREYQSTRQDAEGMLEVMSSLERQVMEYSSREADTEKLNSEYKIKMEEAIMAKDQVLCYSSFVRNSHY
jgi:chromosome segregation ATPase